MRQPWIVPFIAVLAATTAGVFAQQQPAIPGPAPMAHAAQPVAGTALTAPQPVGRSIEFMQPIGIAAAAAYSPEPYVLDYLHVGIDVDSLSHVGVGDVLTIPTPGGQTFAAVVDRVDHRGPMRLSAGGAFADDPEARFNFVLQENVIVGSIDTPFSGRMMQLRHLADAQGVLIAIDQAAMGGCGAEQDDPAIPDVPRQETPRDSRDDDGSSQDQEEGGVAGGPGQPIIDVMIVYTTIARDSAGGTNAIIGTAQDAIDFANECYVNSGINVRLRMVYCGEVSYDENGTFADHINRMNNANDGILDEIHTLRNMYSADVVSLWVQDCDTDANGNCTLCGRAACNAGAGNPFPVVRWSCASGNLSFAHELGHNQGCGHERTTGDAACGPDSARGWFFTGNDGNNYRTVMATVFAPGSRIRYFSNPNVTFRGMPTGNASNYNAVQIANRVADFEGFRTTHYDLWVNFWDDGGNGTQSDPYNSLGQAHANLVTGFNASENPTIWCYSSVGVENLHLNKRCSIRSCGGTIRIIGN